MTSEIWKDIEGYEGRYQVSDCGRVRSLLFGKARILTLNLNSDGYKQVCLYKNGRIQTIKVHRLVAQAFIPNPDNCRDVNHINGDKSNNRILNLEWVSHRINILHAVALGLKGNRPRKPKLTAEQVKFIRENPAGLSQPKLAKLFNTNLTTINRIANGKTYKHVDAEAPPKRGRKPKKALGMKSLFDP